MMGVLAGARMGLRMDQQCATGLNRELEMPNSD